MNSKIIVLRYKGTCSVCGGELAPKTRAHYDAGTKKVTCLDCEASASGDTSAESTATPTAPDSHATYRLTPISGKAGASAASEFERRHQKREEILDRRFGRFAGVVKFLIDDPQSTRSWAVGSSGEQILAEALSRRLSDRVAVLHDRKRPRTTANIDHLVIAASGVWVVDSKKYKGALKRVDKGGWRNIDYHIYVNGRDRTNLASALLKQATDVLAALEGQ